MALAFGRYQLLRKIAAGGMGQVLLARMAGQQGFEKLLVIKRVLPQFVQEEEFFTMFVDEARIAARLNHPNIVQIFDMGDVDGSYYIAMEYVAGEDLKRLCREAAPHGGLPLGLTCRIMADAAAALDHAHEAKDANGQPMALVHRDVSPQNVLIGFDGGVKLVDFGIAKAAGKIQQTAAGVLKGKLVYMSPEQAGGENIDFRSDIFSLGILFWEIVTGRRLFAGENEPAILNAVRRCEVPTPSKVNPAVPAELDPIISKALQRDPAARYASAGAMRLVIEDFITAQRLPASAAHLAAFMHQLYGPRIAAESDPRWRDQLFPASDIDEIPTLSGKRNPNNPETGSVALELAETLGSSPGVARSATPARGSAPGLEDPTPPARPGTGRQPAHATRKPPLLVLAIGLGLTLIAVASAVVILLYRERVEPGPSGATAAPAPPAPAPPAPATGDAPAMPNADVDVLVRSAPPGARLSVDGVSFGPTPVHLKVRAAQTLTLELDGYEPLAASVKPSDAPDLELALKKRAKGGKHNSTLPPLLEIKGDR